MTIFGAILALFQKLRLVSVICHHLLIMVKFIKSLALKTKKVEYSKMFFLRNLVPSQSLILKEAYKLNLSSFSRSERQDVAIYPVVNHYNLIHLGINSLSLQWLEDGKLRCLALSYWIIPWVCILRVCDYFQCKKVSEKNESIRNGAQFCRLTFTDFTDFFVPNFLFRPNFLSICQKNVQKYCPGMLTSKNTR